MVPRIFKGVSLIELLVVIALIALLASMLFLAYARALGKARQFSRAGNQRQITVAFKMYCQDHDDRQHRDLE